MTIRAVLFDIDGTLVDSNDLHVQAWRQAFAETGHAFDEEVVHDQIGKGTDMLVPTLLPALDEDAAEALGERQGAIFKDHYLDRVRPFPGARDLLERVRDAGARVVLASSASKAELDHYMDLLDARGLVDETTCADEVDRTKPAPDIFAVALSKLEGIGADETIVLGDTPYDVEAAAKAGIGAVAVRSGGFADEVLERAGAVTLFDDVAAILADYDRSPLAR